MNERNKAIKELDQVRAQIARNTAKANKQQQAAYKTLRSLETKVDKTITTAYAARDKANGPLLRRAAFLAEEVKSLI